jgi:hypothetical protein
MPRTAAGDYSEPGFCTGCGVKMEHCVCPPADDDDMPAHGLENRPLDPSDVDAVDDEKTDPALVIGVPASRRLLAAIGAAALSLGCSSSAAGIPNLHEVRPGLWRGGQPTTDSDWQQLRALGVKTVVKLNYDSEGVDDGAVRAGMMVIHRGIQPAGDKNVWDALTNTLQKPDRAVVTAALDDIGKAGGVFVHCTHGRDRTGLVVALERRKFEGWSSQLAWDEMIERGFRPALLGLVAFWIEEVE